MSVCDFFGCGLRAISFGLCNGHREQRRKGWELRPLRGHIPNAERIAAGSEVMPDGCILWRGYGTKNGYGRLNIAGKMTLAHRAAWELKNGLVPNGKILMHSCDNRSCVNVDHLSVGTNADNAHDRDSKGRAAIGSRAGRAVLTEEAVASLRARVAAGASKAELARETGVSYSAIRSAIDGRTWRHV